MIQAADSSDLIRRVVRSEQVEMAQQAGRTMIYWLAHACRVARDRAGKEPEDIKEILGCSVSTVYRFETGETWPTRTRPERFVEAYAEVAGIEDSRKLWGTAYQLWIKHGQPPSSNGSLDDLIHRELGNHD